MHTVPFANITSLGAEREVCARVADLLVPWLETGAPASSVGWPQYTARGEDYMQLNSLAGSLHSGVVRLY